MYTHMHREFKHNIYTGTRFRPAEDMFRFKIICNFSITTVGGHSHIKKQLSCTISMLVQRYLNMGHWSLHNIHIPKTSSYKGGKHSSESHTGEYTTL